MSKKCFKCIVKFICLTTKLLWPCLKERGAEKYFFKSTRATMLSGKCYEGRMLMESTAKTKRLLAGIREIKEKAITTFRNHSSVLNDSTLININRLFYLSAIAAPIRVLDIFLFTADPSVPKAWSRGIILSHLILLVFYSGVFIVSLHLRKKAQVNLTMRILQYVIPFIVLLSGIIVTAIDQLVTTNITPFLLVSIVFGAVFLIRPLFSALILMVSYLVYYFAIALTITNPQVLLSNRVNGITAVALGFLISAMSWYYNYTNITQKRRIESQQEQLKQMAYYDPLTNISNRHFFNKTIKKEFSAMQRYRYSSVIIIFDLDDFKMINDTYGHLAGDHVLKQVAQLISSNVRRSDTVSRFGGEEFVILAPRISLDEGYALAEKLRKLIAGKAFIAGSTTSHITASFGVSLLQASEDHGSEYYISLADKALYLAKNRGKNRVEKAS